jgi:hypothetical protein
VLNQTRPANWIRDWDRLAILAVVAFILAMATGAADARESGELCPIRATNWSASGLCPIYPLYGISPRTLSRTQPTPIKFHLGFKLKVKSTTVPPRLSKFELDFSHVTVDAEGLSRCPLSELRQASAKRARELCVNSEVGNGNLATKVFFPEQEPISIDERLIALNAQISGRGSIVLYGVSNHPTANHTLIIVAVRKLPGSVGDSLVFEIPSFAGGRGYLSSIRLTLFRHYRAHATSHSLLAATCPPAKWHLDRRSPVRPLDGGIRRRADVH